MTRGVRGFPTTVRCDKAGRDCVIDFVGYRETIPGEWLHHVVHVLAEGERVDDRFARCG